MKVSILFFFLGFNSFAQSIAPGSPGVSFPWATGEKQGIGTSYESYNASETGKVSKVWFTVARGIVTEVYYPRVDTAQTRDLQFLVTDGKTFLHQEQFDMESEVNRVPGAPLYSIINRDRQGRYLIKKEIWTDPDSPTLIQKVTFESKVDGLKLFALLKPAAANSIFHDTAYREPLIAGEDHKVFGAWQGLSSTLGWGKRSAGFVGVSDGFNDLNSDKRLDNEYELAAGGNVAITAQIETPEAAGKTDFSLFLYFAPTKKEATQLAYGGLKIDVSQSQKTYVDQWKKYLSKLDLPLRSGASSKRKSLLETSILVMKSSEDKTYHGAVVAALSYPWGEKYPQQPGKDPISESENSQGYHLIWPRDLYHIANGFLALGDTASAVANLERYRAAQFTNMDGYWEFGSRRRSKAGSFPQNFWADGRVHWGGYQADQTAMPILLTYRLLKLGAIQSDDYWRMVKDAATFLAEMGPWTNQERWEENYGISPNSAAYVISALALAAEIAYERGEKQLGDRWQKLADDWSNKSGDNIEAWTFTTNGKIKRQRGNGKYFIRMDGAAVDVTKGAAPIWDAEWNPNWDNIMTIANTKGDARFRYESEIVDAGFLELVRLGLRSAKNYFIRESLPEVDSVIRVETPVGPGWYRYNHDGYGDESKGRLWPLLTGERIHYELQWLKENKEKSIAAVLEKQVIGLEAFSNEWDLFSEQVWDKGTDAGKPTASATPLSWAHAEYVEVLRSLIDNRPVEEFEFLRARYNH